MKQAEKYKWQYKQPTTEGKKCIHRVQRFTAQT